MFTWKPRTWELSRRGPLTVDERSLLDGALLRIRRILGVCDCGQPVAEVGRRDRCADCLQPQR